MPWVCGFRSPDIMGLLLPPVEEFGQERKDRFVFESFTDESKEKKVQMKTTLK